MTVDRLGDYLKQHWPDIREQLLNGTYEEYTGRLSHDVCRVRNARLFVAPRWRQSRRIMKAA